MTLEDLKGKVESWKTAANHWNVRNSPEKLKALLLEVLDDIEGTDVQAPAKVRRNSKKKS